MEDDTSSAAHAETRRLAAIMFTDIVGFSRQMGADEARMLRLLEVHNQLIQQAVTGIMAIHQNHWGCLFRGFSLCRPCRTVCPDDSLPVGAVQRRERSAEQIHVRIGIHSGDIVQKDGDVFGDGVNIASRLQIWPNRTRSVFPRLCTKRSKRN